jgi:hypothetical protein
MLKKRFNASVLKDVKQDPDEWLTDLESLRDKLVEAGSSMTEEELLEHALNSLPTEYDVTVQLLEKRLSAATNPLTVEDLREELNLGRLRLTRETAARGSLIL